MAWTSLNPAFINPSPHRLYLRHRQQIAPQKKKTLVVGSSAPKPGNNTDQLRAQLDQLHTEAHQTRAKANNARSRLMRLSEAAEKIRRQAAVDVQIGKENEARELLVQKQKVMQALEKTKGRIELLDELSAKLNEAITVKETQLIGSVDLDLGAKGEDTSYPIRIISPKEDTTEESKETEAFDPVAMKYDENHEQDFVVDWQEENIKGALGMGTWNGEDTIKRLKGISSYDNFLQHLDQQFHEIEVELITILRFSTLVLESNEKQKNSKLQQIAEFLEDVHIIRGRIASIIQTRTEGR
ncbi:forkhead-associated domain protein [Tasmannia lanceolata]|uniref:forkhead-associated domain protein n=1 Tax=Tasmannia lanceolata TaxID=3420 RepID=UPI004063C05C